MEKNRVRYGFGTTIMLFTTLLMITKRTIILNVMAMIRIRKKEKMLKFKSPFLHGTNPKYQVALFLDVLTILKYGYALF